MAVLLVRHAKAGDRSRWTDDDRLRPLTEAGHRQALGLVGAVDIAPTVLFSSPYVRCVETLEPLAAAHGLEITLDDRLAEGVDLEPVLALLNDVPDGAVLCSHGDVIPMVVDALIRRGMMLQSAVPGVKKGSWFSLSRDGATWTQALWHPAPG